MLNELLTNYSNWVVYPVIALILSAFLTRVAVHVLPRLGYVAQPGGRRIHQRLIPCGGGIAIIIAFFFAFGLWSEHMTPGALTFCHRLFLPAAILATLGMIDDRRELPAWGKLPVQLLVAFLVWYGAEHEYAFAGWTLPWYLSLVFTTVWIVIIMNAFNLIDGLDGLASGLAVVSGCCMAIWFLMVGGHVSEAMAMLVLVGACLGFLRYNFHPARIFLGDTGSTFLGLVFAAASLSTMDYAVTATSLLLPLLALGVPLFDVFLAIWRRSARKLLDPNAGGIMTGDQDHLHHRLFRKFRKQSATALTMYLVASLFSGAVLLILLFRSFHAIVYIILLVVVLFAVRQMAGVELSDSARLIQNGLAKPRRGLLLNLVHPFIDLAIITASFFLALTIFNFPIEIRFLAYPFAPLLLFLFFSKTYRVYWLRAGLTDYSRLTFLLFSGSLIGGMTFFYCEYATLRQEYDLSLRAFTGACVLFSTLSTLFVLIERLLLHYAASFWFHELHLRRQLPENQKRIVIYGGGFSCRVYVSYVYCAQHTDDSELIIGLIDDDPVLDGLHLYGFPVFGGLDDIEEIYEKHPFHKLIVTPSNISEEKFDRLSNFCKPKGIEIARLAIELKQC